MSLLDWLLGSKKNEAGLQRKLVLEGGNDGGEKHTPTDFIAESMLTVFKQAYTHSIGGDRKGIHIETILSGLGAMAGFGCHCYQGRADQNW